MKAVLASKNPHKLIEMQAILGKLGIEVVLQSELGIDIDVEETGTTFEENSYLKAHAVMQAANMPAIADDSGIAVDALGGAPGIFSARYGNKNSDEERTAFLLENMEHVPDDERAAQFVCAITCIWPDGRKIVARGECHGVLTREVRGEGGFGYDPIFYVPSLGKTLAEIPAEHKNSISHRAKALQEFCRQYREEFEHDE